MSGEIMLGGGVRSRVGVSSYRGAGMVASPPLACIFPVINRKPGVFRRACSPSRCAVVLPDPRESCRGLDVVEVEMVAHVLPAGVAERLEVPGMMRADGEGGGDEMAAALAGHHAL